MTLNKFINPYSSNRLTYNDTYHTINNLLSKRLFSCFQEKVFKVQVSDYEWEGDATIFSFIRFARVEIYFEENADPIFAIYSSDIDFVEKALEKRRLMTSNELFRDLKEYQRDMLEEYPELKNHVIGYKHEEQDNWSNGLDLLKSLW